MSGFNVKIISGMEKCFTDENIDIKNEIKSLSMLSNERLSFQLAYTTDLVLDKRCCNICSMRIISPIEEYIKVYYVDTVAVKYPVYKNHNDDNYLRKEPGLYPDILLPYNSRKGVKFIVDELRSLFVTVECEDGIEGGKYPVRFEFDYKGETVCCVEAEIEVVGAKTDPLSIYHTEWFYVDCLANYYNVEVWSEKHWEIIEKYAKTAVKCGVNTLLTPIFTPPLDTEVGGERLTTQLIDISYDGKKYSFGYDRVDRWIEMCERVGIETLEINHLFTQWGAAHAPKIMATVNGEYKRIFGWDTDASSKDYVEFLGVFLKSLIEHLKEKGIDKRCLFHISDEPNIKYLDSYTNAKNIVSECLEGYKVIDALSNYEFYKRGLVDTPVSSNSHIDDFIENEVEDLWVYYCCSQSQEVSNRFLSMPGARTRVIGAQIYKYAVKGFLHWGFNFYNTRYSISDLNPYLDTGGEYFTPAGDCFLVYPASDGSAYSSLHCEQMYMALEDHRALMLCEKLIGREKTLELLHVGAEKLTFKEYPREEQYFLDMRNRINKAIKELL